MWLLKVSDQGVRASTSCHPFCRVKTPGGHEDGPYEEHDSNSRSSSLKEGPYLGHSWATRISRTLVVPYEGTPPIIQPSPLRATQEGLSWKEKRIAYKAIQWKIQENRQEKSKEDLIISSYYNNDLL
ncbi:hypothetical protein Salat_1026300 [Sesamum alatum]|uniref:Uncharacterized protein n=1 Tax=Sesamum alatum TaxID=300844 RepID=A0AAE1YLW0_9LAMI|nr:hypothetical protein Salat_1026300 [Sesamum alatum]